MKRTSIIFLLLSIPLFTSAQNSWQWMNPLPHGNNYSSTIIVSPDNWLAAGDYGTIVRSTDKGESWFTISSGTTDDIVDMKFYNNKNGYAATRNGTLLFSNDGGKSWIPKTTAFQHIEKIYFIDSLTGFLIGNQWDGFYKTVDGGNTWQQINFYTSDRAVNDITFTSPDTGYIVFQSHIFKTVDKGMSWFNSPVPNVELYLWHIYFLNPHLGFAFGANGKILKIDPWDFWDVLPQNLTTESITSCYIKDELSYNFLTDGGKLLRTSDGGITWTIKTISNESLNGISFENNDKGIIVSNYGGMYISADGGNSWISKRIGYTDNIYNLMFPNDKIGYSLGRSFLKSTDGGLTWEEKTYPLTDEGYCSASFPDENTGYILTSKDIPYEGRLFKTTDGGITWNYKSFYNTDVYSIFFFDKDNGFLTIEAGRVLKTTDGGISWIISYLGISDEVYKICFTDKENGFLVDGIYEGILHVRKTTDGGSSWVEVTPIPNSENVGVSHLYFVNPLDGFILDTRGLIWKTTDGGLTWSEEDKYHNSHSISFIDENNGIISCSSGLILQTSDRGKTWSENPSISKNDLYSCVYFRSGKIIAAGEGGTIVMQDSQGVSSIQDNAAPSSMRLFQNYPNPFNPSTTIKYNIAVEGSVEIKVYDILGKQSAVLINKYQQPGSYEVLFDGSGLPAGVYFCRLISGEYNNILKMILIK